MDFLIYIKWEIWDRLVDAYMGDKRETFFLKRDRDKRERQSQRQERDRVRNSERF